MPLQKGRSHIGDNIKELENYGSRPRPMRQIKAIALNATIGEAKNKTRRGYKLKRFVHDAPQSSTGPNPNPTNPGRRTHNKPFLRGGRRSEAID